MKSNRFMTMPRVGLSLFGRFLLFLYDVLLVCQCPASPAARRSCANKKTGPAADRAAQVARSPVQIVQRVAGQIAGAAVQEDRPPPWWPLGVGRVAGQIAGPVLIALPLIAAGRRGRSDRRGRCRC